MVGIDMKIKKMTAWIGSAKGLMKVAFAGLYLCTFFPAYSQNPNYVETTVYGVSSAGDNITSRTYNDGLGKTLQSQVLINGAAGTNKKVLVSGTEYDDIGRPSKSAKPFPYVKLTSNIDPLDFIDGSIITGTNGANTYFGNDAGNYAYSETKYYDDPLNRVQATAAPGVNFSFDPTNGHPDSVWTFGVTGNDVGTLPTSFTSTSGTSYNTYFSSEGFILTNQLAVTDNLNKNIPTLLSNVKDGELQYYLTVTKDPNGHYSQTLTDLFGKTVRTWSSADGTNPIVSHYDYDILGQTITEKPPTTGSLVNPSSYAYNTLGQLVSKTTPDANHVSYEYDDNGRIHRTTDANSSALGRTLQYDYDDLGRVVTIAQVDNTYFNTRVRNFYDDLSSVRQFATTVAAIDKYLLIPTNTAGRLAATITYDQNFWSKASDNIGSIPAECGYSNKVIEFYSYDDEGRLDAKFTSVPGLAPFRETYYYYDFQGKIQETCTYSEYGESGGGVITDFNYDANGRLASIDLNSQPFVAYTYDELGKMTQKEFLNQAGGSLPVNYAYNIRDWVKSINANNGALFTENLFYDDPGFKPQYNGNIAQTKTNFPTLPSPYGPSNSDGVGEGYSYDRLGRLTSVSSSDNEFGSTYTYLDDGRINTKQEGDAAHQAWGVYHYNTGNNQLTGIEKSVKAGANFVYDYNGNMIIDQSKNIAIEYDWRDMPVSFYFFPKGINVPVDSWEKVENLIATGNWTRQVVMTYNASGERVKKEILDRSVCTMPTPQTSALLVTDVVSGKSVEFKPDGSMNACMPLKDIAMEPAADALGALLIEKDGVTLLNFSDQAVASKGAMVGYNTNTGTMGDLSFSYSAMSNKPNIIDQNGGYVGIAGNLPQPMPITGVAYVNDQVLTFDPTAGDYELSYTNVGSEGHALADGSREYFVKDHLGSTRLVLTEDFNNNPVKEAMDYLPYGTIINRGNVLQDAEQAREKFTGKEFDEELGMNLTYFGRRYYDPEIGVWTSTDPAEQYLNAYAYCDYDPLNFMDVDGMAGEELIEGVNVITVYGHAASSGLSLGSMLAGLNAMYQIYNMVQTFNQLQQMQQQINRMTFTGENNGVYWQDGNIVNENGIKDASGDLLAMAPIAAPIKGVQEGVKIAQAAKNEIQFAQKGISATFRHGEFAGKTIEDVGAGLRSGVVKPSQLPLQTITREGVTYTVNNRSLMALRMGDMAPTAVKDVTGNAFFERQLTQRLLEIGNAAGPNFVPFIR